MTPSNTNSRSTRIGLHFSLVFQTLVNFINDVFVGLRLLGFHSLFTPPFPLPVSFHLGTLQALIEHALLTTMVEVMEVFETGALAATEGIISVMLIFKENIEDGSTTRQTQEKQ